MKEAETDKRKRHREFSSISIAKVGNEIRIVYNGDRLLYKRLQESCRKRGVHFDFPLSPCG